MTRREKHRGDIPDNDDVEFGKLFRGAGKTRNRLIAFLGKIAIRGNQEHRAIDRALSHQQVLDETIFPTRIALHHEHPQRTIDEFDVQELDVVGGDQIRLRGFDDDLPNRLAGQIRLCGQRHPVLVLMGIKLDLIKYLSGELIDQLDLSSQSIHRRPEPINFDHDRNLVTDEGSSGGIDTPYGKIAHRFGGTEWNRKDGHGVGLETTNHGASGRIVGAPVGKQDDAAERSSRSAVQRLFESGIQSCALAVRFPQINRKIPGLFIIITFTRPQIIRSEMKAHVHEMALLGQHAEHLLLSVKGVSHLRIPRNTPFGALHIFDPHRLAAVNEHQHPVFLYGFSGQFQNRPADGHQNHENNQGPDHREHAPPLAIPDEFGIAPHGEQTRPEKKHRPDPTRPGMFPRQTQRFTGIFGDDLQIKQPSHQFAVHIDATFAVRLFTEARMPPKRSSSADARNA